MPRPLLELEPAGNVAANILLDRFNNAVISDPRMVMLAISSLRRDKVKSLMRSAYTNHAAGKTGVVSGAQTLLQRDETNKHWLQVNEDDPLRTDPNQVNRVSDTARNIDKLIIRTNHGSMLEPGDDIWKVAGNNGHRARRLDVHEIKNELCMAPDDPRLQTRYGLSCDIRALGLLQTFVEVVSAPPHIAEI